MNLDLENFRPVPTREHKKPAGTRLIPTVFNYRLQKKKTALLSFFFFVKSINRNSDGAASAALNALPHYPARV